MFLLYYGPLMCLIGHFLVKCVGSGQFVSGHPLNVYIVELGCQSVPFWLVKIN